MPAQPVEKIPYDDFIKSCSHFLIMPELERQMKKEVGELLMQLMDFTSGDDAQDNLRIFLQKQEDFLGIVLNMTGLPQEKFLRILSAERFSREDYKAEWGISQVQKKIAKDDDFASRIANLLLEGRNSELLAQKVAGFYLDQLSLPENWFSLLQDKDYIARVVRKKLSGKYNNDKGMHFERKINAVLDKAGIPHEKGQVALVQKEVDHAIPSLDDAKIMMMAAYYETTSSGQTARANEQRDMYRKIKNENERYPDKPPLIFINIVDGGGWLARRSDLKKLHASCDYCLNASMLEQLPSIIQKHWQRKKR